MADKMKRVLLLFWHMMWPLLLYEAAGTLVRAEFAVMFPEKEPEQLALPAMGVTAAAACVFLGRWYQEQRSRSQSRGEKRKKDDFLLFVLASAAGAGACLLFNSLLLSIPGMKNGAEEVSRLIYRPPLAVQLLCTGLVIPLAEELLFRAVGYGNLRREMSVSGAAAVSALWFALFHGNPVQGAYAFLTGLCLAFLFEWTDSLMAVWSFHSAANLVSLTATEAGERMGEQASPVFFVCLGAAGGMLLAWSFYRIKNKRGWKT